MGWGVENVVMCGKGGTEGGIRHIAPEQSYIYCSSTVVQQKEKNKNGRVTALLSYI